MMSGVLKDLFLDLGSIEGIAGTHRVAPSVKHAASIALKAGVDADLGGNAYGRNLSCFGRGACCNGRYLDTAVANILKLKFEMGLFENPYVDPAQAYKQVRSESHKQLARQVAREGIVLLKNSDNILPLDKNISSVAVIGPMPTIYIISLVIIQHHRKGVILLQFLMVLKSC